MILQAKPHSTDAEISVLGSLMIEQAAMYKVMEILDEDCFYHEAHKCMFSAMVNLFQRDEPRDIMTVSAELRKMGKMNEVGGPVYLVTVYSSCPTAANVEHYARIMFELYIKRWMIEDSQRREVACFDDTTNAIEEIQRSEKDLSSLLDRLESTKKIQTMNSLSVASFEKLMDDSPGGTELGIMSGFNDIDDYINGFKPADMVVIAARPGMGKTAIALNIARYVSSQKAVGIFSIEMTPRSLYNRLLSSESRIMTVDIIKKNLNSDQYIHVTNCIASLSCLPIFVDDSPGLNLLMLKAKAKRMKKEHGVELIIIDYLQLIKPPKATNREEQVSIISRSIKELAKELNIPIIVLCQLNREVEKRANKTPLVSDLRESGSIEQDADIVILLNRLETYGIKEYESGLSTEDTAQAIIAKNREGSIGTVILKYNKYYTRFTDKDWLV